MYQPPNSILAWQEARSKGLRSLKAYGAHAVPLREEFGRSDEPSFRYRHNAVALAHRAGLVLKINNDGATPSTEWTRGGLVLHLLQHVPELIQELGLVRRGRCGLR